ncbi:hypothetical protein FKV24_015390 [Lysobacter maris]|uniref:Uncharacterized protein n=2 Tax=Marilutibacter maris TaxID=1605891 RepID=A0A508A3F2_9GAMM|nr:hypothetical protein FKV24_015390 [Lysobacter maris]
MTQFRRPRDGVSSPHAHIKFQNVISSTQRRMRGGHVIGALTYLGRRLVEAPPDLSLQGTLESRETTSPRLKKKSPENGLLAQG